MLFSWCSKKTVQEVTFDQYGMQRDTNGKTYLPTTPQGDTSIAYQAQEDGTGMINSLIVSRLVLPRSGDLETIVQANYQQLQKKLTNFKWDKPVLFKFPCGEMRLTWYILDFSYDVEKDQHFSAYQYFFIAHSLLYTISFNTTSSKDLKAMRKSVKTIECLE